jgi:hypothetical protein
VKLKANIVKTVLIALASSQVAIPAYSAKKPTLSITDQENLQVLKDSLLELRKHSRQTKERPTIELFDPTIDKNVASSIQEGLDNVLSRMGDALSPDTKIFVILAANSEFILESYRKIEKTEKLPSGSFKKSLTYFLSKCKASCAATTTSDFNQNISQITLVNPQLSPERSSALVAHEIFHIFQNSLVSTSGNLPCWIHEGQPSFVGAALANPNQSTSDTISLIKSFGPPRSAGTNLYKIESPRGWSQNWHQYCMDSGEYQVGLIANAYLVNEFGWQKNLEFLKAMRGQPGDGISWKIIFQQEFDISVNDFYLEAENYIKWFYSKY